MVLKGQGRPHWSVESMLVIFVELFCFCFIELLNLSFFLAVGFDAPLESFRQSFSGSPARLALSFMPEKVDFRRWAFSPAKGECDTLMNF